MGKAAHAAAEDWQSCWKIGVGRKAYRSAQTADRLGDIAKTTQKASGINRAAQTALKNEYLTKGFKAISEIPEVAGWWKQTQATANAVFKTKTQFRNIAETVAFDVVTSFMIFGEGDESLDETMFDALASLGVDVPLAMQTTIEDSSFERKLKGILDGTLIGVVGGGLVDLLRLRRYARALKEATPAQRRQILKAFRQESDQLGEGVMTLAEKRFMRQGDPNSPVQNALARRAGVASDLDQGGFENFAKAQPGDLPQAPAGTPDPFLYDQNPLPPGVQGGELQINRLVNQVEQARLDQQRIAQLDAVERQNRLNKQGAAGFVSREGQPQLEGTTTPGSLNRETASTPLRDAPYPDNAPRGIVDQEIVPVRVSDAEATVTPQTIRSAVDEAVAAGRPLTEIQGAVKGLLPQRRINQIDYLERFAKDVANTENVIGGPESMWLNTIFNQGLAEGWVQIDAQTFKAFYNRRLALDLDKGDFARKAANGVDQAQDAARYDEWLEGRGKTSENPPNDAPQQRLGEMQEVDQAVAAGERDAVSAFLQSRALDEEQLGRMADEVTAPSDPDQLIADGLGIDSAQVPPFEVQKAAKGRGWEVVSPNGEVLEKGFYTTKKQAQKRADKELAGVKEQLARRAQQQLNDSNNQELRFAEEVPYTDGAAEGSIKLSARQIEEIQGLKASQELPRELFGVDDQLSAGKKTITASQQQMNELAFQFKRLLEGDLPPNRRRVVNNLVAKLEEQVSNLAPEVRRQKQAERLFEGVKRYLQHGDYC